MVSFEIFRSIYSTNRRLSKVIFVLIQDVLVFISNWPCIRMIIIPLGNVEYENTKYEKFLHFKRLRVFLLVIQVQVESYSLDILEKRTRFYETVEVDVDSESKLLFLKLLRDWNRRNIWNQETNILLWRQHFIKFQRNSLKNWWLAVFSQTFKLSTLFSFLALLVVSVQSSSLISEKKVSDHLLLFPIVKIRRRTER